MEDQQVDYKELYFKLFRATETAIRTLIAAQQECEELYLRTGDAAANVTQLGEGSVAPAAGENIAPAAEGCAVAVAAEPSDESSDPAPSTPPALAQHNE